ncbi:MAG: hypothetical protein H0U09_06710 [Geodermatophilaceae bacterium]|nr:hypothetical protein [Geodermatophilaceae bacterium]
MGAGTGATRLAAEIAPVIDRLVIAVHIASREPGQALIQRLGLARVGFLIELRLALPVRSVSHDGLRAMSRYVDPAELDAWLALQSAVGTLRISPDWLHLTDRSREFYAELFPLHNRVATEAWSSRAGSLPTLAELTNQVLLAGADTGGDAVAATTPPYEPPGAGPALLLFNRLAALRYHRADAHAAAWSAAGLTAATMQALPAGARREEIEAETNRLAAPPYDALTGDERLALLTGLVALPR